MLLYVFLSFEMREKNRIFKITYLKRFVPRPRAADVNDGKVSRQENAGLYYDL